MRSYKCSFSVRRPRGRLRKRKRGEISSFHNGVPRKFKSLNMTNSSSLFRYKDRQRGDGPLYGGLHKAWVGFVIAQGQNDYEKMRKYAIAIQKFERRLNIAINEFPQLGLYTADAFENKEEDDDSNLTLVDPWN